MARAAVVLLLACLAWSGCLGTRPPEAPATASATLPPPPPLSGPAPGGETAPVTIPFQYLGVTEGEACVDVAAERCQALAAGRNHFWRLPLAAGYFRLQATYTWQSSGPDGFYAVLYRVEPDGTRTSLGDQGFVALGDPPLEVEWNLSALDGALYEVGAFAGVEQRPAGSANVFLGQAVAFAAEGSVTLTPRADAGLLRPTGSMSIPRAGHTATALGSGQVLVAGGFDRENHPLQGAEVYDPATRAFRPAGSMHTPREGHEAALLPSGKVLVAGGHPRLATAELYDPASGLFSPAGALAEGRHGFTMTSLGDGRVLLVGGGTRTAEVYDPATGRFTLTGAMAHDRMGHTATLLAEGIAGLPLPGPKVLVAGGRTLDGRVLAQAEAYDVATGAFVPLGSAGQPRYKHAAVLDGAGRVLLVGGADERDWQGRSADVEAFDPATGAFGPAGTLATPRFKHGHATVAVGGQILVAGGGELAELLTPEGTIPLAGLPEALFVLAAAPLPGGALVMGGYDGEIQPVRQAWTFERT